MPKEAILSIDDDENLQVVIEQYLSDNGYPIKTAGNVQEALDVFHKESFSVVLLDLSLPDGEGLSLIPQFLNQSDCGLIVVSGKTDTTEKIVCLEMGADDYLTKPFEMRELMARIKAVLRRRDTKAPHSEQAMQSANDTQEALEFLGWKLDRGQYKLFDPNNQVVELTTGEFKLLEILASSPNRVFSRERLFEITREGEYDIYDRAIDTQIARIRKKLGNKGSDIIQTVRGVGYMFCVPEFQPA